ncbi:MAG: orotidine-5'-phosphate decarboxylase [Actinobacteria bacterium]|nr:orotidine-5'-phosphate decarboxylase [Actinomycetota bacterium]
MNPLIVALDVHELDEAVDLARRLEGEVGAFKVGLELYGAHGPDAVTEVGRFGDVFLDLKLHDIPTTVRRAASVLGRLGVRMLTVHASGGTAMVEAAVEGLTAGASVGNGMSPLVLAVTALTSMSDRDLDDVGQPAAEDQVPRLARLAVAARAHGVVCAPRDLAVVRAVLGDGPLVVTPGIRPSGSANDDHARGATPAEAIAAGADHLVIGRPIVRADDPVAAVRSILAEIAA